MPRIRISPNGHPKALANLTRKSTFVEKES